ncbi:MAG TPA: hypothetical protein VF989_10965 [Polyangiaceae bacterium]
MTRAHSLPLPVMLRRRRERGATVFIVVVVISLLTGIGVYAVRVASMVDAAAGNARQAVQTRYMAEYGALSVLAELGSGTATQYLSMVRAATDDCRSTQFVDVDVAGRAPCYKVFMGELAQGGREFLNDPGDEGPGSLGGPVNLIDSEPIGLRGNFVVELTDPVQTGAPVAGTDIGGTGPRFEYVTVTATSIGQVLPADTLASCDARAASVAATQQIRARMVVGPIAR